MEPIVGSGKYTYRVNEEWQRPPAGLEVRACAVSVDSQDRVYCFNRNPQHPDVISDRAAPSLPSRAAGLFSSRHPTSTGEKELAWRTAVYYTHFIKFTTDRALCASTATEGPA